MWICVGSATKDRILECDAVRVVPRAEFQEKTFTYSESLRRPSPLSLSYHAISVQYKGAEHVLVGPEARFEPAPENYTYTAEIEQFVEAVDAGENEPEHLPIWRLEDRVKAWLKERDFTRNGYPITAAIYELHLPDLAKRFKESTHWTTFEQHLPEHWPGSRTPRADPQPPGPQSRQRGTTSGPMRSWRLRSRRPVRTPSSITG
jgi:hypothetical protein